MVKMDNVLKDTFTEKTYNNLKKYSQSIDQILDSLQIENHISRFTIISAVKSWIESYEQNIEIKKSEKIMAEMFDFTVEKYTFPRSKNDKRPADTLLLIATFPDDWESFVERYY